MDDGSKTAEQTTLGNQQESKESGRQEKMLNNRHCQFLLDDAQEALPTPSYIARSQEDEAQEIKAPIEETFFIERPIDCITQISRLESEHFPSVA